MIMYAVLVTNQESGSEECVGMFAQEWAAMASLEHNNTDCVRCIVKFQWLNAETIERRDPGK